jgi:DNA (cytosine-5)-methyltransferase 1
LNNKIRFGSVCSGIEAASVAWHPLGWEAAWLSEIEKFPCEVLKHHYPNTPNFGDMILLADKIRLGEVEAPDVFCGGTPCQAFSVAGLRQSLDDSRGNLSLTFCEIADAIDKRRLIQQSNPAIIFWENVPGVLNTKDNAFGCFLAGLAGENNALIPPRGKWTDAGFIDGPKRAVAWRTLDAQYFGLAQRRKRVFVVASARNDICPAEILFEFEGVRRDTSPSRKEGQDIANCLTKSPSSHSSYNPARSEGNAVVVSSIGYCNDLAPTLTSSAAGISRVGNDTTADAQYVVQQAIALAENTIGRQPQNGGNGNGFTEDGPMYTLNATGVHGIANNMSVRRLTPIECERLQGFPDNYTNIKTNCPDGPRYKALGNSWAVPVVAWIGKRINDAIA